MDYIIEVKTQHAPAGAAKDWSVYGTYFGKTKRAAIQLARAHNRHHMTLDYRTYGIVWWRAKEQNA